MTTKCRQKFDQQRVQHYSRRKATYYIIVNYSMYEVGSFSLAVTKHHSYALF